VATRVEAMALGQETGQEGGGRCGLPDGWIVAVRSEVTTAARAVGGALSAGGGPLRDTGMVRWTCPLQMSGSIIHFARRMGDA